MAELPFAWDLDNNGIKSTAIGTIHACLEDYSHSVLQHCAGVGTALLEYCMFDQHTQTTLNLLERARAIKMSDRLRSLDVQQRQFVAAATGIPLEELESMTACSMMKKMLDVSGLRINNGIEVIVQQYAPRMGVTIVGLESLEEQAGLLFDTMSDPHSLKWYATVEAERPGYLHSCHHKLAAHYQAGDGDALREYLEVSMAPRSRETLLYARNRRMVEKSMPYLASPSIVAVGVGHFLVAPSMLDLYSEKGVVVRRRINACDSMRIAHDRVTCPEIL